MKHPTILSRLIRSSATLSMFTATALIIGATGLNAQQPKKSSIPSHPSKLVYKPLDWEVPLGSPYRSELANGAVVYVAKDSALPLIKVTAYLRYGSLSDPPGKEGLSSLYAAMLRHGGTEKFPADTLDELIDLLALKTGFSAGESQFSFTLSFLSEYSDQAFDIMREMFYHPVFDRKKLDKERTIMLEAIRHRFDNPAPTLAAAYDKQLYARQRASVLSTEASLKNITREDLVTLHRSLFSPVNMIFCISGAFDRNAMVARLDTLLAAPVPQKPLPPFPQVIVNAQKRLQFVQKPISQAYVRLGLPLFQRPHPDYYAMSLLNEILGGGGFTSRLGEKVRSDAGLTYSIYSVAESNYTYPATFYISFFTKNESFTHAVSLTLSIVQNIIDSGVTAEELDNARASLIGELPSMFRSADDIVGTYGWNEYYHRSPDHFKIYEQKLMAITREDLQRVARTYLHPDSMYITVVGDTTALLHQRHDGFSLENLHPAVIAPDAIPEQP